jgi:hypothetical protein
MPCGDDAIHVFPVDNYSKRSLIRETALQPGRKGGDENRWVEVKPVFPKAGFVVWTKRF